MSRPKLLIVTILALSLPSAPCQTSETRQITSWITTSDRSMLFQQQAGLVAFHEPKPDDRTPAIVVDPRQEMQSIDGFGFALTGGTAELLMKMGQAARARTLHQIFASDGNAAGVSYLRVTIGASDMNSSVFSYDDLQGGQTDLDLKRFDLKHDQADVLPVLKEILRINPAIKILASPWSAPAWMKTNNDVRGGSLKKECYQVYADYLIRYLEEMRKQGVAIDAFTIQNEPYNSNNTPSMRWLISEQVTFLRQNLIPALQAHKLSSKLILFDHNTDRADYPLTLLADPVISHFADGTGFHNYRGDLDAMGLVHNARPDKNVYFTEQTITERPEAPALAIAASVDRMIVRTTRNWSRNVILWNLGSDPQFGPHTGNGGCPMCQGAVTLEGDQAHQNLAFYTIAHAARLVRPGSVRIASTGRGDRVAVLTEDEERPDVARLDVIEHSQVPSNVAFKTPDGKMVLIVANNTAAAAAFLIQFNGRVANLSLAAGSVGTYTW